MKQKKEEISFSDIMSIFAPKLWIIVIASIICAAIVGTYSMFFKHDTYTSSVSFYTYRQSSSQTPTTSDLAAAEKMVNIYIYALNSDDTLKNVIEKVPEEYKADKNLSVDFLKQTTTFTAKGDGYFVISVTTEDPKLSVYLAKSYETVAIDDINKKIPTAMPITILQSPQGTVRPNGKGTVKNAVVGFAAGAIVSTVAILGFSLFDTVVRSKKKIEDNLSAPVLGVIPVLRTADNTKKEV